MKWEEIEHELISLRKELHKYPELSGRENNTGERIIKFAEKFNPDEIIKNIGGNGLAVIFKGNQEGKTILIRCELDALPIEEENKFDYKSQNDGVSHKCGHDGHMAIVSGLIPLLSKNKIDQGTVVLLYQPAEETGEGAEKVLHDEKFNKINPDYVFSLHNLPGFEKNKIIIKENEFASASKGLIIKLNGKTSHAAEPEKGITPSLAVSELIQRLVELPQKEKFEEFTLVTIIHAKIGERAFGTTPGYAELMATLRSYKNEDMEKLQKFAENIINEVSTKNNLKYKIEFVEEFPSTVNDKFCVDVVQKSAEENNLQIEEITNPFRWSEDFGHFTQKYKGALFGLGSGVDQPQLHNPDYDFPDEIILTGTKMFYSIIKNVLEE
ncbi:putative hydrolase [hydrocarbon metagenome]|uniref:Putative hydrolase n=1 Tax=hydrocarbon metagenome TaxID=938273 RepID=A0A0W8FVN6_9ZZZZ